MSKMNVYINILNTLQSHKYRESTNLHKMMGTLGMTSEGSRWSMIKRLLDNAILVKQGKVYQVVEHKEYKNIKDVTDTGLKI